MKCNYNEHQKSKRNSKTIPRGAFREVRTEAEKCWRLAA